MLHRFGKKLVEGRKGMQRVFLTEEGQVVSPWHSIPLFPSPSLPSVVHFVAEIPRKSQAKYEICKKEAFNPIMQDTTKQGAPRFLTYKGGVPYNYGALPQTWEDPMHFEVDQNGTSKKYPGDDDPLDAIDLSPLPAQTGQVLEVTFPLCLQPVFFFRSSSDLLLLLLSIDLVAPYVP